MERHKNYYLKRKFINDESRLGCCQVANYSTGEGQSFDFFWKKLTIAFAHSSDNHLSVSTSHSLLLTAWSFSFSILRNSCLDTAKDWRRKRGTIGR